MVEDVTESNKEYFYFRKGIKYFLLPFMRVIALAWMVAKPWVTVSVCSFTRGSARVKQIINPNNHKYI